MKIVDINLLIYAINRDAPHHKRAKAWLENALNGDEPVGLAWVVILGFLRIVTHPRIMPNPLPPETALELMDEWLAHPNVQVVLPTARHWAVFKELISPLGTAANLTSDAHLAALAVEHGAYLYSTDNDFSRFSKLRWASPMA